jgi:hypothetical protein
LPCLSLSTHSAVLVGHLATTSTICMLDLVHIRKEETSARARTTIKIIQLIIDNTCSFATASTTEINTVAYQQRVSLQEYRLLTAQDPIREKFVVTVGCDDFNTTPYVYGSRISIPNLPHLCCFCESLLAVNRTWRSIGSVNYVCRRNSSLRSESGHSHRCQEAVPP